MVEAGLREAHVSSAGGDWQAWSHGCKLAAHRRHLISPSALPSPRWPACSGPTNSARQIRPVDLVICEAGLQAVRHPVEPVSLECAHYKKRSVGGQSPTAAAACATSVRVPTISRVHVDRTQCRTERSVWPARTPTPAPCLLDVDNLPKTLSPDWQGPGRSSVAFKSARGEK